MSMLAKNIINVIVLQTLWSPYLLVTTVKQIATRNPSHSDFRSQKIHTSTKPYYDLRRKDGAEPTQKKGPEKTKPRTTVGIFSLYEECDYLARPCLHSHRTGKLCAKSQYSVYQTFRNYCMLEFVNCREGYDIWFPVYMGACIEIATIDEYMHYPYKDDFFLDNMVIREM
ncbi:unnamed protein product [Spodoptera littoralis]|uniref:Uncharacterized protein n=1 Tax=Spodoptera littoralis TaxID=7109 RepID=A0A9P0I537_SPOLI|nr:unnamed protein product [Spodoptera littoralis]CAH1641567.1 unnamed protein product [Spodoptera littoralis]